MPPHIQQDSEPVKMPVKMPANCTAPRIPGSAFASTDESGTYRLTIATFDPATGEPVQFSCSLHTESKAAASTMGKAFLDALSVPPQ